MNYTVIGAQYGDEGKGKIVDFLLSQPDFHDYFVTRFQGGANAGHTIYVDGKKIVLHQLPSGIIRSLMKDRAPCIIGQGCCLDLSILKKEIENVVELIGAPFDYSKLIIDSRVHLVMPWHKMIDMNTEMFLGNLAIGTTGRGIGPCYASRAARLGLRLKDLFYTWDLFYDKFCRIFKYYFPDVELENFIAAAHELWTIAQDFKLFAQELKNIDFDNCFFEGAQGAMLDIDHGTYPYVTSSHTNACGIPAAMGFAPNRMGNVLGVAKAYCTRVGNGTFASEIQDPDIHETIQRIGKEFGSTTGRSRRCGWFNADEIKEVNRLNDFYGLAITKIDVLSALEEIFILHSGILRSYPGWKDYDITGIRSFEETPQNLKNFIKAIEDSTGIPVLYISVGPNPEQTFEVPH